MGTNTGQVMTLANSIIGVSVLAMPFCFKQCGIVLSVLLLCLSSILSRFACHFLLKAAIITRRRNYEFLAFHVFGSTGKLGVELSIIGFLLGTCVAFFVVMGDLGPAIISSMLGIHRTDTLRTSILIGMALFVVLPLGLLRNVDSLSSLCTASIAFYLCLVLKVIGEATGPMVSGDWLNQVNFWRPEGVLQCLPIFSMALFCQTQLFEIFDTVPNAALDKLNAVIRVAVNMCTAMYILVGVFGYIAFSKENISGNILVSLSQTMSSEVIKLGFVLSVAVSFPLVIFPCRASLYSLLYRNAQPPVHDLASSHVPEGRFKVLTFCIVGVSLVVGLLLPNIERVLGIIGSTIGVTICIILPSLLLGNTARHSKDRLFSQVILWSGAIIMILGTYAHILNSEQATDSGFEQVANRILDHAVDHLNEPPQEAIAFQPLLSNNKVKKLIETSEEKSRNLVSDSGVEKKQNALSLSDSKYDKQPLRTFDSNSALKKEEKSSDRASDLNVVEKPLKIQKKILEPAVLANTGEKQQEPPVPVEAVVKQASAEPVVPVVPAPSSESVVKEPKMPKRKMKIMEQINALKNKTGVVSNAEQVNQDAIRHEDAESALEARDNKEKIVAYKAEQKQNDLEEKKKKEDEKKLIETLKEHQEVQRDMLYEQQRILQELKKHEKVHEEKEKASLDAVKEPLVLSASLQNNIPSGNKIIDTSSKLGPAQSIGVIQQSQKESIKEDYPKLTNINNSVILQPPLPRSEGKIDAVLKPVPKRSKFSKDGQIMPLPLAYSAKISSSPPPPKIMSEHSDAKPGARDILESALQKSDREKRDLTFVSAIDADQGAGNGPMVVEEEKQSEKSPLSVGEPNDECLKNSKILETEKQNFQGSVVSVSETGGQPVLSDVGVSLSFKSGRQESGSDFIQKDQSPVQIKESNAPVMELKTPSSISEPRVDISGSLHVVQSIADKTSPISEKTLLKYVQSKEGQ
ncbi:putative sodium-coupled neutral amino acid transporter 10 [Thrips palmi]|uniref:Sodium-coupled neutral amino acid transporter 10 n=1 Tax=Thrips palmi TaxID=161013 RepID=A0A6P8ZZC8_THRPL|nr:putative sodium-coupled neutral amino acid transporter 10 [Thrips palmi]